MYLEKNFFNNNGFHKKFKINNKLNYQFKIKFFNYKSNNRKNQNLFNRKLNRSQKPIDSKFRKILYYKKNNLSLLIFSLQFILNKLNNKVYSLFTSSNGIFFYYICSSKTKMFSYYKNNNFFNKIKSISYPLVSLRRLSKICLIPNTCGNDIKYCLAVGSYALLESKIIKFRSILIKLPSGKKKLLNWFIFCQKGKIKRFFKKKLLNTKASSLRLVGKKANSRGNVMNPVDHPHGGNTKSIKLHKTPWGLVAKKK